jgi:hypothetical protein
MVSVYEVRGQRVSADADNFQEVLAAVYNSEDRPLCMCAAEGVPMYVAKYGEYVLKRMPDTGPSHHPSCDSFEPEPGVSGRAELGAAIDEKENQPVEIKLGFALSRYAGRPGPTPGDPSERPPGEVDSKTPRCSLRALVHYLWEEAGLNRWYPRMKGKRGQWTLHKYLIREAQRVRTKGVSLGERLYVPEVFRVQDKEAIAERRRQHLAFLHSPEDNVVFKMGLVIGEYNGVEPGAVGMKLYVKHAPDAPLHIDSRSWERVRRNYGEIMDAVDADVAHKPHVVLAAVIYAAQEGMYQIESMSMMLVSDQWLPVEGVYEIPLLERLIEQDRVFIKPLRYDAKSAAKFPNVLLLDAGDEPIHMHVISPMADEKTRRAKEHQVRERGELAWEWDRSKSMPQIPPKVMAVQQRTPRATQGEDAPARASGRRTSSGSRNAALAGSAPATEVDQQVSAEAPGEAAAQGLF